MTTHVATITLAGLLMVAQLPRPDPNSEDALQTPYGQGFSTSKTGDEAPKVPQGPWRHEVRSPRGPGNDTYEFLRQQRVEEATYRVFFPVAGLLLGVSVAVLRSKLHPSTRILVLLVLIGLGVATYAWTEDVRQRSLQPLSPATPAMIR